MLSRVGVGWGIEDPDDFLQFWTLRERSFILTLFMEWITPLASLL